MGQAASYAESSVQRALLKLKHEEQVEEDELLAACGYRRPSATATKPADVSLPTHTPVRESDNSTAAATSPGVGGSGEGLLSSVPLSPPPESLGPFVSLTPEYYTLDELRDALRYLPDTLWLSLYRVSLLYILDNDHDGRVKSTDISFFMDWGIKTVARDVPPAQLAEVLQTYAALHCWRRCLHVGEAVEEERAATQTSGRGTTSRARRRPMQGGNGSGGGGGGGGSVGPSTTLHHHYQQSQSVASFMLMHLREAFSSMRPGEPAPLPSSTPLHTSDAAAAAAAATTGTATKETNPNTATTATTTATTAVAGGHDGSGDLTSPAGVQFFSPRSAVTQPVTSTTRLEAAAHFAEWMLRLVQNQERDRRHERHRFERRLRLCMTPEVKLCNSRLRHSQFLQHHSMRLRGGSLAMLPSTGDNGDGEDVITSQSCMPPLRPSVGDAAEAEMVVTLTAPRLSLAEMDTVAGLTVNISSSNSQTTTAGTVAGGGGGGVAGSTPARGAASPFSRSITPLGSTSALVKAQRDLSSPPLPSQPHPQAQQQQRPPSRPVTAPNFTVSSSSRALPSFPHTSSLSSAAAAALTQSDDTMLMGSNPMRENDHTDYASGAGVAADGPANSPNWYSPATNANGSAVAAGGVGAAAAAPVSPEQLSTVLMDAEAFYAELEKNGWCTIGAVEEAYLDFAVEDSYCLSFWAFCRLLNEASADEMQAALDLTTAQATAVLTSAAAVEDYRRAAAVRRLQRLRFGPSHTLNPRCGWERQMEVVPMFLVSEYTFVTFVTAFIHAYWDMLESMGIDAVTQPTETASMGTARSATSPGPRPA